MVPRAVPQAAPAPARAGAFSKRASSHRWPLALGRQNRRRGGLRRARRPLAWPGRSPARRRSGWFEASRHRPAAARSARRGYGAVRPPAGSEVRSCALAAFGGDCTSAGSARAAAPTRKARARTEPPARTTPPSSSGRLRQGNRGLRHVPCGHIAERRRRRGKPWLNNAACSREPGQPKAPVRGAGRTAATEQTRRGPTREHSARFRTAQ